MHQAWVVATAGWLLCPLLLVQATPSSSRCRVRPTDPDWPSTRQWQSLNASIDGTLANLQPVAAVCHAPLFDAAACADVTSHTNESAWRVSQAAARQNINWEAWPARNESCYVGSPPESPCRQGRVALYTANVEKVEHIQRVVRFVKKHNVRLVIKNTGHCYLGRSSAPESVQISTHKLASIQFFDNFVPKACGNSTETPNLPSLGSAVTIGAGVVLKQLYDAVGERNLAVVGGFSHTVGAAGGYVQGGGHSPMGYLFGMGSDNALQYEVVTADGNLVVANEIQHRDLYWALRGGGGGTFGVVVSVTLRTFPDVPALAATLTVGAPHGNGSAYWDGVRELHANVRGINDAGGSGYYYVVPQRPGPGGVEVSSVSGIFFFMNATDIAKVQGLFAPLLNYWNRTLGDYSVVNLDVQFAPLSKYVFQIGLMGDSDETGTTDALGSRLISRDFLAKPDGPARLVDAMKSISAVAPNVTIIGHLVAGGKVASNTAIDSALNPAWRRTLTHIVIGRRWDENREGFAREQAIWNSFSNVEVPLLKALEPDMGAYINEANAYERDWQKSFWGPNYARLYSIKKKWDPKGIFIARRGVGSEDWDDDGLCRA